jgi:membrane-associated phospholipid phosphatase
VERLIVVHGRRVAHRSVPDPAVVLGESMQAGIARLRPNVWLKRERAWTISMTILAIAATALCLALMSVDEAILRWCRTTGRPLSPFFQLITPAGKFHWYILLALVVFVAAGLAEWKKRTPRARAALALAYGQSAYAMTTLVSTFLAANVAKIVIGRTRPILLDEFGPLHFVPFTTGYAHASFPSGHATACGTFAAILVCLFPRQAPVIFLLTVILASSRAWIGAHYASDVAAGFAVGFLLAIFIARLMALNSVIFRLKPGIMIPRPAFHRALR